jgi:hypothetical protein
MYSPRSLGSRRHMHVHVHVGRDLCAWSKGQGSIGRLSLRGYALV